MTTINQINEIINTIQQHVEAASLIQLMPWVIIVTAILFIVLHGKRHQPILAHISVLTGFIPVLIHELGHAITATLTRGRVNNIYMALTPRKQRKTGVQGQAETSLTSRTQQIAVAFMGYVAPPLVLLAGIYLATHNMAILFIVLLILGLLYYLTHTSQIWIPVLLIIVIALTGADSILSQVTFPGVNLMYSIILGLLAGETLQSISLTTHITFNFKNKQAWDGRTLQQLTFIPAIIWWLIWTTISIATLILSAIWLFS